MPILSYFFGIYIRMFYNDHAPPHFHVEYQGYKVLIAIETGAVVRGQLPRQAMKLVEEWRQLHRLELNQAWELAKNYQNPQKIAPLEND